MVDFTRELTDNCPARLTTGDGTTWSLETVDTDSAPLLSVHMAQATPFLGLVVHRGRHEVELTPGTVSALSERGLVELVEAIAGAQAPSQCVVKLTPTDPEADPRMVQLSIQQADRPDTVVVLGLDVTDVLSMQQQLSHTGQMAAFGEMAAALFHEIGNPMGALFNALYILKRDLPLTGDDGKLLELALEEAGRLNDIIKHFRSFARFPGLDLMETDLNALVAGTVNLLSRDQRLDDSIHIEVNTQTDRLPITVDTGQIREVLFNLLINAVEAMTDGGRISLSTRRAEVDGQDHAIIDIEDNGPGIRPASLSKIFQPFYSTKNDGIGIGLAIAQRIVQAHGGDIEVESTPGEGTTFRVALPIRSMP